jgi:hypothetical protein
VVALAAFVSPATPVASARAVAPPTECRAFSFSPSFRRDGTAMCLASERSGDEDVQRVYVTTDGGRRWQRRAGAGLDYPPYTVVGRTWVSPLYASDRSLFVGTTNGIYASRDGGQSFALLTNQIGDGGDSGSAATPYVRTEAPTRALPGAPTGPHTTFVMAAPRGSGTGIGSRRLEYPPVAVPVPGSPGLDQRFLIPAAGTPLVLARVESGDVSTARDDPSQLFGCTQDFACSTPLFRFPVESRHLVHHVFSPGYARDRTLYLTFTGATSRPEIWRSTDAGQTFHLLKAANAVLPRLPRNPEAMIEAQLAVDPGRPSRLFLHVGYWGVLRPNGPMPPSAQLFRSDDHGAHWSRIGFQLFPGQRGRRGTLPWNTTDGSLVAPAPGKLFAAGGYASGDRVTGGLFCSVDAGRTWQRTCRR